MFKIPWIFLVLAVLCGIVGFGYFGNSMVIGVAQGMVGVFLSLFFIFLFFGGEKQ